MTEGKGRETFGAFLLHQMQADHRDLAGRDPFPNGLLQDRLPDGMLFFLQRSPEMKNGGFPQTKGGSPRPQGDAVNCPSARGLPPNPGSGRALNPS
jgi:hypothetical protein